MVAARASAMGPSRTCTYCKQQFPKGGDQEYRLSELTRCDKRAANLGWEGKVANRQWELIAKWKGVYPILG